MFVRFQGVRRDGSGAVTAGSASIYRTVYDPGARGRGHSRQEVVELLGRVVWTDGEERCRDAIFLSPTRGLVEYLVDEDRFLQADASDPRLAGTALENVDRDHAELGPAYLFLALLCSRTPLMGVLREAFPDSRDRQRVLAHVAHGCLAGRTPAKCGAWLAGTALSWALPGLPRSTLDCDTAYFRMMGDDAVKVRLFRALVAAMRAADPGFGRCCYVDSTPLPGEARGNPFNALCSHGTDGCVVQSRLALVLDAATGVPVWFRVVPSNVLDRSTLLGVKRDAESTLGVTVDELDLDSGYAVTELFEAFNRANAAYAGEGGETRERALLVRMPARAGYPHDELYLECKPRFHDTASLFDLDGHTYFGERVERDVRGFPEHCYVCVDHDRAAALGRRWRECNPGAWEGMSAEGRDWYAVKDGFFVLVGTRAEAPREALARYRSRAEVESFFKDAKSYLRALPVAKWTRETVLGKVLSDVVEAVLYRAFRRELAAARRPVADCLLELSSLEATRLGSGLLAVSTPKRQVAELFASLGMAVPGHLELADLRRMAVDGEPPDATPVTARRRPAGRKPKVKPSPEEKARAAAERHKAQAGRG